MKEFWKIDELTAEIYAKLVDSPHTAIWTDSIIWAIQVLFDPNFDVTVHCPSGKQTPSKFATCETSLGENCPARLKAIILPPLHQHPVMCDFYSFQLIFDRQDRPFAPPPYLTISVNMNNDTVSAIWGKMAIYGESHENI